MIKTISSKATVIFLWILCCTVGCKNPSKKPPEIEIRTYAQNEITYPKKGFVVSEQTKEEFLKKFFLPWDIDGEVVLDSLDSFPGKKLSYLQQYLEDDEWYGENKKPHKKFLREAIVNNISNESFPNFLKKGIVVAHTNLRRIPSHKPGFDTYSKAGEGFPFDYFQETNLWANTPVQLIHLTNDKQWCYVLSPYYKGWVPMKDLGIVSEVFITNWKTGRYAMPLADYVQLEDPTSHYALNARLGMVLPFDKGDDNEKVTVFYTNTNENQEAKILKATVPNKQLAFNDFEFNGIHLKELVSNLIGRPYGWGGNLENRDCSSMIRDMMATYQIWLPRDSKDLIEIGQQYKLTGTIDEKIARIKENGIPFRTILRKKGHNMLYVGNNENGEPLIFHAIWGLKTTYDNKELSKFLEQYPIEGIHQGEDGSISGRHILGEAVITSVLAGKDNHGITVPLMDEIYVMTTIL
ncbi:MAG: SH3 domain-containing protein [Croceivirga sp.]